MVFPLASEPDAGFPRSRTVIFIFYFFLLLLFAGELLPITTKYATNPGPWARMPLPPRLPGLQEGALWHLHFLATRVFLLASAWPLIFLAPSPCRSSDLFTPARISEVQMYM